VTEQSISALALPADVLGVRVDPVDLDGVVALVDSWIESRAKRFACLVNVHVVETARKSPELQEALRSSALNLPDGAPVAWLAGRRRGNKAERVTGSDVFAALCGGRTRRHFFFGSTTSTLTRLIEAVEHRFPEAEVAGSYAPPFRSLSDDEATEIVGAINAAEPDVVWVGLGAPRQELWMLRHREHLNAPALIGVGAVFDFASGAKRRAPAWAQRSGLEWLHRLASEPRRLTGRYVTTNSSFVVRAARAQMRVPNPSRARASS
jgi:N-acetylglucosaminyldiphosphoundecaprenol N-acetyl-beta-D-mannosaminyltransferase